MVIQLGSILITYLSRLAPILMRIVGGNNVLSAGQGSHIIANNINRAIDIATLQGIRTEAEANYDLFSQRLGESEQLFNSYEIYNSRLAQTETELFSARRNLRRATRSRNNTQITQYQTLVSRLGIIRTRRRTLRDEKYNTLVDILELLIELAIDVLEYDEEIQEQLPA